MSTVVDFYIQTHQTPSAIEKTLRDHLRTQRVDPAGYWIHVRTADAEAHERGRRDFGLEPTVIASIQPPRGQGDAELEAAALATAHGADAQMVAFHDGTPMFSYRAGVAYLSPEDREYYEEHVLPGFAGGVAWGELLPWLETGK
jgi:hypothetical protein